VVLVLAAIAGACIFGFVTSIVFPWASGKSALWSMWIGAALFIAGAAAALLGIVLFCADGRTDARPSR
jgi:hypothetical protein